MRQLIGGPCLMRSVHLAVVRSAILENQCPGVARTLRCTAPPEGYRTKGERLVKDCREQKQSHKRSRQHFSGKFHRLSTFLLKIFLEQ
ncbi:hypothetical protein D3C73_1297750 [compost metagenome]